MSITESIWTADVTLLIEFSPAEYSGISHILPKSIGCANMLLLQAIISFPQKLTYYVCILFNKFDVEQILSFVEIPLQKKIQYNNVTNDPPIL